MTPRALIALGLLPAQVLALSLSCTFGARCLESQGTRIPRQQAHQMMDACEDFTERNLGAIAVRLSFKELQERTKGNLTPLARAWHAYDFLYDSPLVFRRPKKAEDLDYGEVVRACAQLNRDAANSEKWTG